MEQEKNSLIMFPYVVHEGDMAREERKQTRLWILMLAITLLASIIAWRK
jgi:hypothetical protein